MANVLLGLAVASFIMAIVFAVLAGLIFIKTDVKGAILFLQNKSVASPQGTMHNPHLRKGVALLNRTSKNLFPSKSLSKGSQVVVQRDDVSPSKLGQDDKKALQELPKKEQWNSSTIAEREPSESSTTLLGKELSESPTALLVEEASEASTTLLESEESENPTSLLTEDTENLTVLLGQESSENPTVLLDQESTESPTSLLCPEESEQETTLLLKDSESSTALLDREEDECDLQNSGEINERPCKSFKFEIKQKDICINTEESM